MGPRTAHGARSEAAPMLNTVGDSQLSLSSRPVLHSLDFTVFLYVLVFLVCKGKTIFFVLSFTYCKLVWLLGVFLALTPPKRVLLNEYDCL